MKNCKGCSNNGCVYIGMDNTTTCKDYLPINPSPQRQWIGLTHKEKSELWEVSRAALPRYATYASLVEAKLKKKNYLELSEKG